MGTADEVFDFKTALGEGELAKSYYTELGCKENFAFSIWNGGHTISDGDDGYDFIFSDFEV